MKFVFGQNDYLTNATQTFQELWNDQDCADVTLATVDDKQVRAHKIILSSGSTFFKNIFGRYPHQNPLIYLKDIQYKYLDLIIEFIYTGQCDVEQTEIVKFLSVGKDLGVIGLLEVLDNNEANIAMEDDVGEVQRNENIQTRPEQRDEAVIAIISQKGNECEAVYRLQK